MPARNVVFYEAALLVENRAHHGLAGLIVVASTAEAQEARLVARDSLTLADARARIAAQAPLAAKLAVATWVIHNDGQLDRLSAQVDQRRRRDRSEARPDRPRRSRARRRRGPARAASAR